MTRRIVVSLESRATYGYSRNVMREMQDWPDLKLATLVTGMHLMPELGNSVDLIERDGFPISARVPLSPDGSGRGAWSRAMGRGMVGFADALESLSPDILLLSGDRAETLALCVTASYMGIPIAHIQAGDRSGHIDDAARYAIAKLTHIHFASCEDSVNRLLRMGEQPFRVHNVGAPQLDDVVGRNFRVDFVQVGNRRIDLTQPYILLLQHPVMAEREAAGQQMKETIEAALETELPIVWIYPNSDLGYKDILNAIEWYRGYQRITILDNVERDLFLTILANAAVLVGNSSSGILEAPSFRVPVVNVGNRQRGRFQACNILNCRQSRLEIAQAILRALGDESFRRQCENAVNPYGDGRSSTRICTILRDTPIDGTLTDKEGTY